MAAAATTLQPVVIVAPSRVPRGFMPAMTASGQFRVRTDDSIAPRSFEFSRAGCPEIDGLWWPA